MWPPSSQGAEAKARAVARSLAGERPALVLGADTEVVLGGRLMGKPGDAADAVRMLAALRGQVHDVITGVAVVEVGPTEREVTTAVTTRVTSCRTPARTSAGPCSGLTVAKPAIGGWSSTTSPLK